MAPNVGLKAAWTKEGRRNRAEASWKRPLIAVWTNDAAKSASADRRQANAQTIAAARTMRAVIAAKITRRRRSTTNSVNTAPRKPSAVKSHASRQTQCDRATCTAIAARRTSAAEIVDVMTANRLDRRAARIEMITDRDAKSALCRGASADPKNGRRPQRAADHPAAHQRPLQKRTAVNGRQPRNDRVAAKNARTVNRSVVRQVRTYARSVSASRRRRGHVRRGSSSSGSSRSPERCARASSKRSSRKHDDREKTRAKKERRSPTPMPKRPHRQWFPVDRFDGTTPWRPFAECFHFCAKANGWGEAEKGAQLQSCLKGMAAQILCYGKNREWTFRELYAKLEDRFGSDDRSDEYLAKLETRRRGAKESLQQLCHGIEELVALAYPGPKTVHSDRFAITSFLACAKRCGFGY